jgi:hypothetical protein
LIRPLFPPIRSGRVPIVLFARGSLRLGPRYHRGSRRTDRCCFLSVAAAPRQESTGSDFSTQISSDDRARREACRGAARESSCRVGHKRGCLCFPLPVFVSAQEHIARTCSSLISIHRVWVSVLRVGRCRPGSVAATVPILLGFLANLNSVLMHRPGI